MGSSRGRRAVEVHRPLAAELLNELCDAADVSPTPQRHTGTDRKKIGRMASGTLHSHDFRHDFVELCAIGGGCVIHFGVESAPVPEVFNRYRRF